MRVEIDEKQWLYCDWTNDEQEANFYFLNSRVQFEFKGNSS